MTRWPMIVWPAMTLASLLIVVGSVGRLKPELVAAGGALAFFVFLNSVYLALRRWSDRARRRRVLWAILGVGLFYLAVLAAASLAGWEYAVLAGLAGLVPMTAIGLLAATITGPPARAEDRFDPRPREASPGRAPRSGGRARR